jgi:hypothetical protein
VAGFNFADRYKIAGLAPGPEIIGLRQEPFERLRKEMKPSRAVDLTRLYYGLESANAPEWFRAGFAQNDPSFSMIDNEREAGVLACCLLGGAFEDGLAAAALAPLTAAAVGNRKPIVCPEFLDEMERGINAVSISNRERHDLKISVTRPGKQTVPAAADALAQTPDLPKAIALIKQVSDESFAASKMLSGQTFADLTAVRRRVIDLQEEVQILWWFIGGWSRALNRPFAELPLGVAAVMAGIDVASLISSAPGPVAVPALLRRLLNAGRKKKARGVAIKDAVSEFPAAAYPQLSLSEVLGQVADICPVLAAFWKAAEVGDQIAWQVPYRNIAHLSPDAAFAPIDLAVQTYRETMLVSLLHAGTNG